MILHSAYQLAKDRTVTQSGCGLPIIGQQVRELACGVRADAGDDIGEVGLRVEAIAPALLNHRVDGGGALSAGSSAGTEAVLASAGDSLHIPLTLVVAAFPSAVADIAPSFPPSLPGVSPAPRHAALSLLLSH